MTADVRPLAVRTVALEEPPNLPELMRNGEIIWVRGGEGFVAWGRALRFDAGTGPGRFDRVRSELQHAFAGMVVDDDVDAPGSGPVAFGSFTFDERAPGSVVVVPAVVVAVRDGRAWRTTVGDGDGRPPPPAPADTDRIRYAGSTISEISWLEAVASAEREIRAGVLDKVVLARDVRVWSKTQLHLRRLAQALVAAFPECFTFALEGLVGATPELLARRFGRIVESIVLAGSARRGSNPDEDARLGALLLGSDKDRREHELAVVSVQDALRPLCARLDVQGERSLLRLANVQHLSTLMRGALSASPSALELAGRLHPTAAVCGVPRDVAMRLIRALEGMDRGRYSGPIGWVDGRGDGEWAIALRCAEVTGTRARLFAGAGIVAGSMPESELEETRLKLRAMQSAFER